MNLKTTHHNGELKLYPEAVLGIFPQAGSQLVPDYLALLEKDSIADLEDFFAGKSSEAEAPRVREENLYTPFVLDAYQEAAIKAVKHGRSIVVQGPPGTGKSQMICNLLADAMAAGKRALLVMPKARGVGCVVYKRMAGCRAGRFPGVDSRLSQRPPGIVFKGCPADRSHRYV